MLLLRCCINLVGVACGEEIPFPHNGGRLGWE